MFSKKLISYIQYVILFSVGLGTVTAQAELRWDWQKINHQQTDFLQTLKFPEGFVWGVGDSAFQTEGPISVNGTIQENSWTEWEKTHATPENYVGIACDRWNRYKEDFQLLKNAGFSIYRTSVEWSKIEPQPGVFNEQAMQHYIDIVDELLRLQITPVIVLYHHTEPLWFAQQGGFEKAENNHYFVEFAQYVFEHLHDKVKIWMTLNEPTGYAMAAYFIGKCPPTKKDPNIAGTVLKNYLNSHVDIYHLFKKIDPTVKIGYTTVIVPLDPYYVWNPVEVGGTYFFGKLVNETDLHFFKTGVFKWYIPFLTNVSGKNPRAVGALDFIGVNFYGRVSIKFSPISKNNFEHTIMGPAAHPFEQISTNNTVLYPEGLYRAIKLVGNYLGKDFPMYVGENGVADNHDEFKQSFIRQHLYATSKACQEGYNILGYFYWTLMDNYEWTFGYQQRFGLYHVDFATQQRTLYPGAQEFISFVQSQRPQNKLA